MTLPKHQNPQTNDREATAPYNFVPLPEQIAAVDPVAVPGHDRYLAEPNHHTGHLTVTLTAASPMYIRCGEDPDDFSKENKADRPDFFTHPVTGRPVIPGSSLRGMLRSLIEIVSYGKVQPVSTDQLIYRVIGDQTSFGDRYRERLMHLDREDHYYTPLLRAGYMEKRGLDWYIRPAQEIEGTTFARVLREKVDRSKLSDWRGCRNARKIWAKLGAYGYKNVKEGFLKIKFTDVEAVASKETPGYQEGVWVESGHIDKKVFDRVIYPPVVGNDQLILVPEEMVMAYQAQVTQGQQKVLGNGNNGVLQPGQPVFYLVEDDELVFFGHTMMLRLPYPKTPLDFVPPFLRDKDTLDLAEAMFGYVDLTFDPDKPARAGRLFFCDAALAEGQDVEQIWLAGKPNIVLTPKILSGPKPTAIQHYLTQQTPDLASEEGTKRLYLSHYASPTPEETVIRGHKLYWHKPLDWDNAETACDFIEDLEFLDQPQEKRSKDKQHTKIKPVKAGTRFEFKLHFENLTEVELGAVLWVLDLGADADYRLKLGMGKPLGMGAVKTEADLFLTDRQARYQTLFAGEKEDKWQLGPLGKDKTEAIREQATKAFEAFILQTDGDAFAGAGRLTQLKALLRWPGPELSQTKYIDNLKQYRERQVLPTPTRLLRPPEKQVYPIHYHFEVTLTNLWNKKLRGVEVTMPNGERGVLDGPSRKQIEKELNKTLEVVVASFSGGVYHLDFY